jgi:hypothetical protein
LLGEGLARAPLVGTSESADLQMDIYRPTADGLIGNATFVAAVQPP